MVRPKELSSLESVPQKVSERIAKELEGLILRGGFAPGDRLPPERALAEQMSASRPSVREAIHKLEARGLLKSRRGGGTFVRDAAATSITDPLLSLLREHPDTEGDFLEFRALVEQQAAYWAAVRATEPDLELLEGRLLELERVSEKSSDRAEHSEADANFHLAIAECAHNSVLLYVTRAMLGALREDVYHNREKLSEHHGFEGTLRRQHRAIFNAILAGDPHWAKEAAKAHTEYLHETLLNFDHRSERKAVAQVRLHRHKTTVQQEKD